jgi:putative transposase
MIDRSHALLVVRQAELAGLSRASVYYLPRATSDADQKLMKRIDAIHLEYPFTGARILRDRLLREGFDVGRRHIGTLMAKLGIETLDRKPNTSRKHPKNKVHPYLLRGLKIERANHVWATDITYIPMAQGWVYLCAIVDWASRRVLANRITITMETDFCLEALHEAFTKRGQPEIFNTDQGSQFTSLDFTSTLADRGIKISMDGRVSWRDNVFVERLWRSIKYEEVYLHASESVSQAKAGIGRYIEFYNTRRPQSTLDKKTPDEFYFASLPALLKAA